MRWPNLPTIASSGAWFLGRFSLHPSVKTLKPAILLDVETTGLDQPKDEIIELGMVKFDYLPNGRIASLREVYTSFNEPSEPIPLEVTALTGITNDMVAGQRTDDSDVFAFPGTPRLDHEKMVAFGRRNAR